MILFQTKAKKSSLFGSCCLPVILFLFILSGVYAQPRDDSEMAQQYLRWIHQAIGGNRWSDAYAAMERAADFSGVSSDISYLRAVLYIHQNGVPANPANIIYHLDRAIETNRWIFYDENLALLLKAEQLIIIREYNQAVSCLDQIGVRGEFAGSLHINTESAMLRLLALRGMASGFMPGYNHIQSQSQFRSAVLSAMDRYPRDPRPLRIFFEYVNSLYARNINPVPSALPSGDLNLVDLALRRLPFLLETDPELAWMAAPFYRDTAEARRLVASYRAGGISHVQNRDFYPHPGSIPVALNLGLIDDNAAVEELFSGSRGFNYPFPYGIDSAGYPVLDMEIITDVYRLLRSEAGRNFFMQKLLSFSGFIFTDDDNDGNIDSLVFFRSGAIESFIYDADQSKISNLDVRFSADGVPVSALVPMIGQSVSALIEWERYPSIKQITLNDEIFFFGPGDFQYAPVVFTEIGGSNRLPGFLFPAPSYQYIDLTYRTLISFCSGITRPSMEFSGALETIYLSRGVLIQAVEYLNSRQVSVTEFERGLPVIQYVDLDLDGRMETIRRFRRPPQDYIWHDLLDFRRLIATSESDWTGDGRFKTMEVYQTDGSVLYYFDLDGTGEWTYIEE